MPRQTDQSDEPSTLPQAELNPLLNPVLGQNMGRWAEVYFTSPPDKREQAVLELVKELEAQNPAPEDHALTGSTLEEPPEPVPAPVFENADIEPVTARCQACGRQNPTSHRFCGICGARLEAGAPAAESISESHDADLHLHRDSGPINDESQVASPQRVYEPASSASEFSLFHRSRREPEYVDNDVESDASEATPAYRIYIGAALIALLLAVGYMGRRTTQSPSRSFREMPQDQVSATQQSLPAASPPPQTSAQAPAPKVESSGASATDHAAVPVETTAAAVEKSSPKPALDKTSQSESPAETENTKALPTANLGNGAEELATAQSYLNGTGGHERNMTEATRWLWKAISKHNGEATLLLSDLYLKGEGVPKNCDQARVLLDAAARKGMKDAGDRLRHLQAFGCQ